jgi:hypothetical protein
MSGGSWNYAYSRLDDEIEALRASPQANRRALGNQIALCMAGLKAVEWFDSSDIGPVTESAEIRTALGANADALILREEIEAAKKCIENLQAAVAAAEKGKS